LQFFRIIGRELRVAARQKRTWWRRFVTLNLGAAVLVIAYLMNRQWSDSPQIGREVFDSLVVCGFIFSLLTGPLTTTDCLSRERREGTLGLLFLTNLRSRDVVFGKIAVSSFDMVLILIGAMPLVAVPFLMGGLDLVHFALTALTLFNVMFLSLAAGIFFSSFASSGRIALGLTLLFLFFITLGIPMISKEALRVLQLPQNGGPAIVFCMFSPLSAMVAVMDVPSGTTKLWEYWTVMGGLHGLAWLLIVGACWRTAKSWRTGVESLRRAKWKARVARWHARIGNMRWRKRLLDASPMAWLESRRFFEAAFLAALVCAAFGFWIFEHLAGRDVWPDEGIAIGWAVWVHYILCLWIAVQAPRRLADDKQSGALELLLCTPLTPRQIVKGCTRALLARFGTVAAIMILLDAYSLYFCFTQEWPNRSMSIQDMVELCLCGVLVVPLQTYTFIRLGVYQGLAQGNSLRATFKLIAKVGLLPWALYILLILGLLLSERYTGRWFGRHAEAFMFGIWIGLHVLICLGFLLHGNYRLKRHFRALASQTVKPPWWKRLRIKRPSNVAAPRESAACLS
jgi:ABC-type transport system involved in cytochrome c biogenesis permease component